MDDFDETRKDLRGEILRLKNILPFKLIQILLEMDRRMTILSKGLSVYGGQHTFRDLVTVDDESAEGQKIDGKLVEISEQDSQDSEDPKS